MNNIAFPKVAIIILNWNGGQITLDCLNSLNAVTYPNFETVLVDNGSNDGSLETISREFPNLAIIAMEKNLGYVEGNNAGIHLAQAQQADHVLLLNNDTVVAPDFLNILVNTIETSIDIGAVGPTIYYFDRPDVIWSTGGAIDWKHGKTHMLNLGDHDDGQLASSPREVDFISGCALLVRKEVIQKVGLLDPRFFAYYEETEWCVRIRRAGYRLVHSPRARIWHKISLEAREASPAVQYYMTRNRLLFLKLTHAGLSPWFFTLFDFSRTLLSWTLKPRWRDKKKQQRAMVKALVDFGQHRFGQFS